MHFPELDEYRKYLKVSLLSDSTIELRISHLRRMVKHVDKPIDEVTTNDLIDYLGSQSWKPSTHRSVQQTFKSYFRWRAEIVGAEDLTKTLPKIRAPRLLPRPARDSEILDAISDADPRVIQMLELMAYAGLRRCEVCKVKSSDITGRGYLRVVGKGGHEREVPIPGHLRAEIENAQGYLFPGQVDGHLSAPYVGKLVSRALPEGTSGHMLRHRFATAAYRGTHDIRAVQALLGHARLDTTMCYTAIESEDTVLAARAAWGLSC